MATVVPFRAWRYDLEVAGNLYNVTAPPYDVIGHIFRDELYELSPYNVVRVDFGRTSTHDTDTDNRYTRAADLVEEWRAERILVRDEEPTITVVEESYTGPDGRPRSRRGFLALVKLQDFSEGVVFPHEATLSGPKRDRYRLMEETRMNLSPVFMLYSLPDDSIMATWDAVAGNTPPSATMTDPAGNSTSLWPTSDPAVISAASSRLASTPLLIADGHHRYETALAYRDARHAAGDGDGPWDYALVYLCNMEDPGLAIFATHRLLHGLNEDLIQGLPEALSRFFTLEHLTDDPRETEAAIAAYLEARLAQGGAFGLYGPSLGTAYGLALRDPHAPETAADDMHSQAYHRLDVAILHNVILSEILCITQEDVAAGQYVTFVKNWDRGFERLATGESQIGFFMNPIKLRQVHEVALGGERLPQKSTYFYPKLPTGLLFHDLRSAE
ncbi:MAG: DUF1015 domain-containing protein [Thermoleophilia bacterium]